MLKNVISHHAHVKCAITVPTTCSRPAIEIVGFIITVRLLHSRTVLK